VKSYRLSSNLPLPPFGIAIYAPSDYVIAPGYTNLKWANESQWDDLLLSLGFDTRKNVSSSWDSLDYPYSYLYAVYKWLFSDGSAH